MRTEIGTAQKRLSGPPTPHLRCNGVWEPFFWCRAGASGVSGQCRQAAAAVQRRCRETVAAVPLNLVAVRTTGKQPRGMRKKLPPKIKRTLEQNGESRHTDVYRWLKAHHTELSPLLMQCRPSWAVVAASIAGEGVKGPQGQTPSADAVRRIWHRLCRDLAESERQRRTGMAGKKTSGHGPIGWRPPVVERPAPSGSSPPRQVSPFAPAATSSGSDASDDISPEQLRAGLAEVIAKRSGR